MINKAASWDAEVEVADGGWHAKPLNLKLTSELGNCLWRGNKEVNMFPPT